MPSRTIWRWGAFLLLCAAIAAFLAFDLGTYLSLEFLKASQHQLATFYAAAPFQTLASYFLLYVLTTALSLPGAAVLTLAGGALFGVGTGLLVVSFASSLGATLAMLIARFLLKDWVQQKFGQRLEPLHSGVEREGAYSLFALRLVPAVPFFLVNLGMGLTRMPALKFYLISQTGMLPGTLVYVNAGSELGKIESLADVASPTLIGAFVLLAVFPWLVKTAWNRWRGAAT